MHIGIVIPSSRPAEPLFPEGLMVAYARLRNDHTTTCRAWWALQGEFNLRASSFAISASRAAMYKKMALLCGHHARVARAQGKGDFCWT